MAKVLVPLAAGCEEIESVTVIDILRRAEIDVTTAGLDDQPVKASRGVVLVPDTTLDLALVDDYDMVVLPGGRGGAERLAEDDRIKTLLKRMAAEGKYTCAICAGPSVLAKSGLLDGKTATAFPGFIDSESYPNVTYTGGAVERDGTIVTSRGPGTAMDFALALVETLAGKEKRDEVEQGLVRELQPA